MDNSQHERELEGLLVLLHQTSDLSAASFNSFSSSCNWFNATPTTMRPLGIVVSQNDGSGGRNGATRVKMEPNDNNERAAARPPAQDGASTYIKREVEEGFYEQTSFPAEGSPTMMEVIADMNEKCANERRINQDLGAIIQDLQSANNALHSVNQTLMLQGGSAQVLSDKNQQIGNQVHMIQDLQRRVEYLERFGRYRR